MKLDKQNKLALLVIDVQQDLFQKSHPVYKADELLDNINSLVERAHQAGVPVFYIQHSGKRDLIKDSGGWQLHPRLQPQKKDYRVSKLKSNSFENTNLDEILKSMGVDHVVITGMVTHGCVKNGCIGAKQLGYKVTLAQDSHSNFSGKAAQLIEEWNEKLRLEKVELKPASDIMFS